ncbi:MAG: transglycosylase SLT domain-containing protein [Bacteroidales bacterium]|nr:transglycosylase SLT domain-containing protein [Bacteroidales bacterium]
MVREMAIEYGVNPDTAIRIANCESKMGKYQYNLQGSSAKGLFQFIDNTWKHYCEGDVLNNKDNARCFMELYSKYPNWWSCK